MTQECVYCGGQERVEPNGQPRAKYHTCQDCRKDLDRVTTAWEWGLVELTAQTRTQRS